MVAFDMKLHDEHQRAAVFAEQARNGVQLSQRRIVIVGARGWIGRTLISLLHEALGAEAFSQRVVCFGSSDALLQIDETLTCPQRSLMQLELLEPEPTVLFHLAFLTKDKVAGLEPAEYVAANRALSDTVLNALDLIGADKVFVASSGAAAFADDPAAASDLRLYGQLKLADEKLFKSWAEIGRNGRKAVIGRIYSVSGPWMNKHGTYALASFILSSLKGEDIAVRAPMLVYRSYVAIRELLSVTVAALLVDDSDPVLSFSTGGKPLELAEVAAIVAEVCGGQVQRANVSVQDANHYCGDETGWNALLHRFGMTHLPLSEQVIETADYLSMTVAPHL